ncbi:flagellar motor protein MotB [Falsirhodobacter algicola]|uniref:Chemotaxis protein MotB n=1 Tax=Falsirhodobacter algicola TaxID=2692330 RepID=A0A8J8SKJ8_9RHOB|nr:flagellar motor protein MotB [Falsirhodobacter algicola]QUS36010.1 chemotaxis protein MotB [Falsirhodobacter algicola]
MDRKPRPIIVKRRRAKTESAHHGGAWKVAYADFVTAMMAFFLLLWLLNATTEKQRKGLADFFNPTIPINRISGGGADVFGGDSVFSEDVMAQSGSGASRVIPTELDRARGDAGQGDSGIEEERRQLEELLRARGGESMTMERALKHVVTRVTDQGLVIEVFDLPDVALFTGDTAEPRQVLRDVARILGDVLPLTTNALAVSGHVRAYPVVLRDNPVWRLSAERAQAMRGLLGEAGLPDSRISRVEGHADRMPVTGNPMAVRNNRIEVILLRRDR